jgi:hypothetical protein
MDPVDPSQASTVPAYDLRVSIQDTVWRRLLVPETITVPELHRVLQAAFGWENRHLFGIRCVDRLGQPRAIIGPDGAADEVGTSRRPASSSLNCWTRSGPERSNTNTTLAMPGRTLLR